LSGPTWVRNAGLQQQAEQAELQELRPLAALDPEQTVQQPLHAFPSRGAAARTALTSMA
jgi:hypothetical protein